MRIARVRAGGHGYARAGGIILKMGKWGVTEGVRSRAPPVADTARRSTRSGRKERASEQREVLFGYHKAGDRREPTEGQGHGEGRRSRRRAAPVGRGGALRKQRAAAPPWPAGCRKRRRKKNSPAGRRGREELDHYLRSVGALAASTRFSALVTRLSREVANSG